jgi:hypothetical protein
VRRLIRRAAGRLGEPDRATTAALAAVRDPRQAERLLSLLHEAKSWKGLVGEWRAEWEKRPARVGQPA